MQSTAYNPNAPAGEAILIRVKNVAPTTKFEDLSSTLYTLEQTRCSRNEDDE